MKTGPNRKTIGSDTFFLNEPRPAPLGKVGRVDFALLPAAEKDILDEYVRYKSRLRSEQISPDVKGLREGIDRLDDAIQRCTSEIVSFLRSNDGGWERLEHNAALNDLLFDHGFRHSQMASAAEEAINNLSNLGMFLIAAKLALATRVDDGEVVVVSSKKLRQDHFRRLYAILAYHGLDQTLGENSLIIQIITRIDGKWKLATKAGPEAEKERDLDSRRRKELASEIKEVVNPLQEKNSG